MDKQDKLSKWFGPKDETVEPTEYETKIAEEYKTSQEKIDGFDSFNVENLDEEKKKKIEQDIKDAQEIQKQLDDLDPCNDLGICSVAAKYMAQEMDGPEIQLLYFLIGKNNAHKLRALGYRLYRGTTDVELLKKMRIELSEEEVDVLKSMVDSFENSKVDFKMLLKLLKKD